MKLKKATLAAAVTGLCAMGFAGQASAAIYGGAALDVKNLHIVIQDETSGAFIPATSFDFRTVTGSDLNGVLGAGDIKSCGGTPSSNSCGGSGIALVLNAAPSSIPGGVRVDNAFTFVGPSGADYGSAAEVPEDTFRHLSNITSPGGEFACYVYSKKALPRELVDDYFRKATHTISKEEMWKFSEQLTELGKRLSNLKVSFESPDIPLLGIKGGTYDIQRFIYWNFIKCFWKEEWGFDLSKSTNFDWYAPSNAKRFSKQEFLDMVNENRLQVSYLHEEEACYSGRFLKP